jgi:hypothetical protein
MRFPFVSHDPDKATIAVVNDQDEMPQAYSRSSSDTVLDVLIALGFGETVRVFSRDARGNGGQRRTDLSINGWQV